MEVVYHEVSQDAQYRGMNRTNPGKCTSIRTFSMQVQGMRKSDIILEPTPWIFIPIAYHSSYYINSREVAEGKRRSLLYPPTIQGDRYYKPRGQNGDRQ